MDLIDYLRIIRRRWLLVVVPVLLGLAVAAATMPKQEVTTPVGRTYAATATIVFDPSDTTADNSSSGPSYDVGLDTVALFAQSGEIPRLAAKRLGYSGEPQVLASQVRVTSDTKTDSLQITAGGSNGVQVTDRVNAFAQATVSYFHDKRLSQARSALTANQKRVTALTAELQSADQASRGSNGTSAASSRANALRPEYNDLLRTNYDLRQVVDASGPLQLLQKAVAVPQDAGGLTAPSGSLGRLGIAGVLGLLIGLALALLVDRLDTRVHSRRDAEAAFGLPVLAEIPRLSREQKQGVAVGAVSLPQSRYTEAYRELRSSIMVLAPVRDGDHRLHRPGGEPIVILVGSPRRAEGRSTAVADLAGVMAEAGQRVLVLAMDLRNADVHELLGVEDGPGLSELMDPDTTYDFLSLVRPTDVPGVEIITAGSAPSQPRALLVSAEKVIAEARRYADVVLVDSPAALEATDAADLAQFCDVTVVLARADRTSTASVSAMQARLDQMNVHALGAVLIGSGSPGRTGSVRQTPSASFLTDPEPRVDEPGPRSGRRAAVGHVGRAEGEA